MRFRRFLALILSMLLGCLPTMQASTPSMLGKADTKGAAEINGVTVPGTATVYSGDRFATRENGAATLSLRAGDRLFLPASTTVQFQGDARQLVLSLEKGALAVSNRSGEPLEVWAGGARVRSTGKRPGVFEVAVDGSSLRVLAHKGTAVVVAADRTLEVREGMLLNATMALPQGPAGGTSGLTAFQAWAIVIAVAAGVVGLTLGVAAFTRSSPEDCRAVSPSFVITCD